MQNCDITSSINSLYWWLSFALACVGPACCQDSAAKSVTLSVACVCVWLCSLELTSAGAPGGTAFGQAFARADLLVWPGNVLQCSSVECPCTLARACCFCSLYATLSKNPALLVPLWRLVIKPHSTLLRWHDPDMQGLARHTEGMSSIPI